jgi:hypothetical protein
MEFREIYCLNCKRVLGRYNSKFYDESKIEEVLQTDYGTHVKNGHQIYVRKLEKN